MFFHVYAAHALRYCYLFVTLIKSDLNEKGRAV